MAKKQFNIKAIITDKRGRVLSIGENSYVKTHPMMFKLSEKCGIPHKHYLHAEVHAILRCRDLSKAHKISVYRFDANDKPANAKPCPICATAIQEAGIKLIEHT